MAEHIDLARIASAVSRPGIDPRCWTTLAVVNAVNVTDEGTYFDVTTITGLQETAVYTPSYGGDGYGEHKPVEPGAMVLIAIPEGSYGAGCRVIGVAEDKGAAPSSDAVANPEDFVLVVRKDKNYRLVVDGEGDVVVEARGTGKVTITASSGSVTVTSPTVGFKTGALDPSDPVLSVNDGADFMTALAAAIQQLKNSSDPSVSALTALQSALTLPTGLVNWPVGNSGLVVTPREPAP